MSIKVKSFTPNRDNDLRSTRKENAYKETFVFLQIKEGKVKQPIQVRIYKAGRNATACIWVSTPNHEAHGGGKAAKGGYSNPTEATYKAAKQAGFEFEDNGSYSIGEIIQAIADYLTIAGQLENFHA